MVGLCSPDRVGVVEGVGVLVRLDTVVCGEMVAVGDDVVLWLEVVGVDVGGSVVEGVRCRVGVTQSFTYGSGDGLVGMHPYTEFDVLHTTSFT